MLIYGVNCTRNDRKGRRPSQKPLSFSESPKNTIEIACTSLFTGAALEMNGCCTYRRDEKRKGVRY